MKVVTVVHCMQDPNHLAMTEHWRMVQILKKPVQNHSIMIGGHQFAQWTWHEHDTIPQVQGSLLHSSKWEVGAKRYPCFIIENSIPSERNMQKFHASCATASLVTADLLDLFGVLTPTNISSISSLRLSKEVEEHLPSSIIFRSANPYPWWKNFDNEKHLLLSNVAPLYLSIPVIQAAAFLTSQWGCPFTHTPTVILIAGWCFVNKFNEMDQVLTQRAWTG